MRWSIDFEAVLAALGPDAPREEVGVALLDAASTRYEDIVGGCQLENFKYANAHFLFDLASPNDYSQADRTVAAYALTPDVVTPRDANYQRGFPMSPPLVGSAVDRGHLIPRLSGGEYGPNIFRQDRALNRGWSEQGKRYRVLEQKAATLPGALYFGHLIYDDDSDYPVEVETGWIHDGAFLFERFNNNPDPGDAHPPKRPSPQDASQASLRQTLRSRCSRRRRLRRLKRRSLRLRFRTEPFSGRRCRQPS